MKTIFPRASLAPSSSIGERVFEKTILRLVKGGPERQAIEARQVDAIVDPAGGGAILLPDAQRALRERAARQQDLLGLGADWSWAQDEEGRFVSHTPPPAPALHLGADPILGKALWDLAIENLHDADWRIHRQQVAWHAPFRDLEVRYLDRQGVAHFLALSGEPTFDDQRRFTGYHGIARRIAARRQFEYHHQERQDIPRGTLDALATPLCVVDSAGIVLLVNRSWHLVPSTWAAVGAGVCEGANYLDACDTAPGEAQLDGATIAAAVRQVIAGAREGFQYEFAQGAVADRMSFALCVRAIREVGRTRAVITMEDVTPGKRLQELLVLEVAVARCLGTAADVGAGLQTAIRTVCEAQGWNCGRYFGLDRAAGVLRHAASWGVPGPATGQFLERSRDLVFRQDAGLAGRAVDTGQAVWARGGAPGAPGAPCALAPETDGDGAFVFPVTCQGKILGVLAFSSHCVGEPHERLLQTMRSIGDHVGVFLQRMAELEALRRSEARFRKLTEIAADWHWEQDQEFRFTRYAGSGPFAADDVLGSTHWELPDVVPVDPLWAEHRARLAARWSFCDCEFSVVDAQGQPHRYLISGEPVYDSAGAFAGYCGTGLEIGARRSAAPPVREAAGDGPGAWRGRAELT